jgi:inhibitor of cysteine peptidase
MVSIVLSILLVAAPALGAMEGPMNQNQVQDRDRVQTNINEAVQEQIRLEINNRLRIDGSALEQMKLRAQEQTENRFMDLRDHWSRDEVGQSYNWGFVNGYPDGSFRPEGIISGTEGILMLTRMMNTIAAGMPGEPDPEDVDWNRVPEWARDQLREGMAQKQLTRAEAAAMMNRVMMRLKAAPTEYFHEPDMLTVILHENPTTGYGWVVEFEEGDILKIESDDFVPFAVAPDLVGSGGERTWVFTPEKSGTEEITFIYYRSWESKDTAIETRALKVEVDENLEISNVR